MDEHLGGDKFWMDDPKVLFEQDRYSVFFPGKDMTRNEQLNAITRYAIYLFIILLFFAQSKYWLYIPAFLVVVVIALHNIELNDPRRDTIEKMKQKAIAKRRKFKKKKACQVPTFDNPYMNPLQQDFSNDRVKLPACRLENEGVEDGINHYFNENLYKNAEDLFEKKNSERQFYTVPATTVPNDQIKFAEWLWKEADTCKYNGIQCLEYEDIRFH